MKEETILNRMNALSEESVQKYSKGGKMSGGVYTDD
jgi:hypothetical protein